MFFVDWYSYIENLQQKKVKTTKSTPKGSLLWKDIITGTLFFVEKNTLDRIISKTKKYVEDNINDIEKIRLALTGKGDRKMLDCDVGLFAYLPYTNNMDTNKIEAVHRICDHLSIKAGIFYALYSEKYEKSKLVMHAFLHNVNMWNSESWIDKDSIHKYKDTLNTIDDYLNGNINERMKNMELDIVKGSTVKVKKYFLETDKIKDIRGASIILDRINRDIVKNHISDEYIPESIIYCGGGNVLAIVPKGRGCELSEHIEKVHEEIAVNAQSAAAYIGSSLYKMGGQNYKSEMGRLESEKNQRQMLKVDYRFEPTESGLEKLEQNFDYGNCTIAEDASLCCHCNMRKARFSNMTPEGVENLCLGCFHKNFVGGRNGKTSFVKEFEKYSLKMGTTVEKIRVDSIIDIAKNSSNKNRVAVIYGDGNNMGSIIQNIVNLAQMKMFSEAAEKSIFNAVFESLRNNLANTNFEIIAIGGDDIFMIVPADSALEIAIGIGEEFDNLFKNHSSGNKEVTMSIGVAIGKHTTPVKYLFDVSQQLLKSAKQKSRNAGTGTLDFICIDSNSSMSSSIGYLRKKIKKIVGSTEFNQTLRPYTWNQARTLINCINKLKEKKLHSKAYSFREALNNMESINEANLFYLYQMSRMGKDKDSILTTVMDIAESFGMHEMKMNIGTIDPKTGTENVFSPWTDIVEGWDYAGERGGHID